MSFCRRGVMPGRSINWENMSVYRPPEVKTSGGRLSFEIRGSSLDVARSSFYLSITALRVISKVADFI